MAYSWPSPTANSTSSTHSLPNFPPLPSHTQAFPFPFPFSRFPLFSDSLTPLPSVGAHPPDVANPEQSLRPSTHSPFSNQTRRFTSRTLSSYPSHDRNSGAFAPTYPQTGGARGRARRSVGCKRRGGSSSSLLLYFVRQK